MPAPDPGCRAGWVFPAEIVAVAGGLSLAGLLVLTGVPNVSGRTASTPLPTATAAPRPSPIPATGNVLSLTSDAGDYIGQGRSLVMTEPTWRFLANQANGPDSVTVSVETVATANFVRWTVWLAAPRGQSLHPGTYSNAVRAAFRTGSAPGIDVFGDGRGCNQVIGSFTVTRITAEAEGHVTGFEASFVQHCDSPTAPALRGVVRFGAAGSEQQVETPYINRDETTKLPAMRPRASAPETGIPPPRVSPRVLADCVPCRMFACSATRTRCIVEGLASARRLSLISP